MDLALNNYIIEDEFGTNFNPPANVPLSPYTGLSESAMFQLIPATDNSGMFFLKYAYYGNIMDITQDPNLTSVYQGQVGWTTPATRNIGGEWEIAPTSNVGGVPCGMISNYLSNICLNSANSGGVNTLNSQLQWTPYTANTIYQDWIMSNCITNFSGVLVTNVISIYVSTNITLFAVTNTSVVTNATNVTFITNQVITNGLSLRKL